MYLEVKKQCFQVLLNSHIFSWFVGNCYLNHIPVICAYICVKSTGFRPNLELWISVNMEECVLVDGSLK